MATIYQRLSKRVCTETGMAEILIRLRNGKDYDLMAKSGIFVTADNFRNGEIVVNRRKVGNDVKYHEEQAQKMDALCTFQSQNVTRLQSMIYQAASVWRLREIFLYFNVLLVAVLAIW